MKEKAKIEIKKVMKARRNAQSPESPCGGYPLLYVFKQILNGAYKRNILPKSAVTKTELMYENFKDFGQV